MSSSRLCGFGLVAGAVLTAAAGAQASLIVPAYHSLPGAHAKLYVDFDGTTYSGTWAGKTPGTVPAYDVDGDPANFSTGELANIQQIAHRVAEKYSPFNIDVTTVNPGNENNLETAHLVVGGNGAWYGAPAGGVALVGGFSNSSSNTAWVFPDNLAGGDPKDVAEATSHEAGHLFGLNHQSTWALDSNGKYVKTEYSTNGNNPAKRPVMGSSYGSTRGLWWYGTTTSPTTYQDDLAVLSNSTNAFGYRADDFGNTPAAATSEFADATGHFFADGVIGRMNDVDLFSFTTGAGAIGLSVSPSTYGGMLDASLKLFASDGTLLQSAATSSLSESLGAVVSAGTYFVGVYGAGNYGDLGQYKLSGRIVPVPEPAAALMAVLGATVTAARRRRKA